MLYNAINYTNQMKALESFNRKTCRFYNSDEFLSGLKREDKIIPVVTIVIYFSPDRWNGPSSLYEMFEWSEIPDNLKEYIQNYKIILLQPCDIAPDKLDKTESTLGKVMGFIKYSTNEKDFNNYIDKSREEGKEEGRIEGKILAYYDFGMNISEMAKRIGITEEEVIEILERNN